MTKNETLNLFKDWLALGKNRENIINSSEKYPQKAHVAFVAHAIAEHLGLSDEDKKIIREVLGSCSLANPSGFRQLLEKDDLGKELFDKKTIADSYM